MKKSRAIMHDPVLITRVKQYLEENVDQTYVDVAIMARQLQERYREYNRRKSAPFRHFVEQAYKTVLHSYGIDSNPSSDENGADGSDLEMMEDNPTTNHLNNILTNLYSKTVEKGNEHKLASNDNELIDISSDESTDENKTNDKSKKNQTKTSSNLKSVLLSKAKNNTSDNGTDGKKNALTAIGRQTDTNTNKKRKLDDDITEVHTLGAISGKESVSPFSNYAMRARSYKKRIQVKQAQYAFRDVGGMDHVLKELCELLFHIKHPEIYMEIGLSPPRGFLLHGPPGCGKTMLAQAIAGQLGIGFIEVPATEIIAGVSGESEERIREIFEQAANLTPCVLFIDEIDAISSNRSNAQKDMERRIVAQLISSLDGLSKHENSEQIIVIGATNRPEVLDPALRRVGRFDHEISLGIPNKEDREEILLVVCETLTLRMPFDYKKIAELTPGYVGADLVALASRAASIAVKRKLFNQMDRIQKLGKNIPIVDLIEENANEVEEGKKDESSQENDKEARVTSSGDKVESRKEIEPKEATAKTNESKVDEDNDVQITDETTAKSAESTKCAETKEMDVDVTNESISKDGYANVQKTKHISKVDEPIDVEEIPDSVEDSSNSRTRANPSLWDLVSWLSSDVPPFRESQLAGLCVTMDDFIEAIKVVQPSAKREGFITVPDVTWDDIGSLKDIREELQLAVLAPVKYPEKMKILGLNSPSGILLCGPPGCGKTLLAKAVANEAGINFISVKGPELLNMYVGESERAVRQCFQRARNSTPCVIFFDEFDSLCPRRSDVAEGGSSARLVNQLLTEMDGIEDRKGVFLMAATNRPDIIDPAVLRPGRLDTVLYVGFPNKEDRIGILEVLTKHRTQPVLEEDVSFDEISELTEGYTGADLSGLLRQASLLSLKESISNPEIKNEDLKVKRDHLLAALKLTKPSVNEEDKKLYEKLRIKYAASRNQSS